MNFGELIELKLEKKNMLRKELYEIIKNSFYDAKDEKYISMPTFNARIAENKISAEDIIYMSAILDIDLGDLKNKVKRMIKNTQISICEHIKLLMKISSAHYCEYDGNKYEVEFLSTNETSSYRNNRFYMITMNDSLKMISLELFDFDMNEVDTLISIKIDEQVEEYNDFKILNKENKLNYLFDKIKEYEVIFGEKKLQRLYEENKKIIESPQESIYEIQYLGDVIENTLDNYEEIEVFKENLENEIKKDIGYGFVNKLEKVFISDNERNLSGKKVSFKVVSNDASYDGKCLKIYYTIRIDNIW